MRTLKGMADAGVWRRRRGASIVRGAVVVGWLALASTILAWSWSGSSSESATVPSFGAALATTLAALLIVPAVWCIPVGAVLDHHLSRYGALALALIHAIGCIAAFVVTMTAMTLVSTVYNSDILETFALLAMFFLPPTLVIGYLLAMLVPGSFPRHPRRGLSGVSPAFRALAGGRRGVRG